MRVLLTTFALSFLLFSCSGGNKTSESESPTSHSSNTEGSETTAVGSGTASETEELNGEEVPVSSNASSMQGFVVVSNQRYAFNLDIPADWKALDVSDDSDGFIVQIPEYDQVDIRAYGEKYDELLAPLYEENCKELAEFEFANEQVGKRCIGENEISYWVLNEGNKLNVYIKGWNDLDLAQKTNLTSMVRSLRPKDEPTNSTEVLN